MDNYSIIGKIGEGAHGTVMKGRIKNNGKIVAMKKIVVKNVKEGVPVNIFREIQCLKHISSKYVNNFYCYLFVYPNIPKKPFPLFILHLTLSFSRGLLICKY